VDEPARAPADFLIAADDPRITRVGAFLRRWSLDELPQLWNVLAGDMSIVGPRPTLRYQVERYDDFQRRRLEVLPGVTGWAQISGRNQLRWPERIELDVWYVDHRSLALDLRILASTVPELFRRKPIYGDAQGDWGERDGG
jgi:lipopolysaccharide/colanic/teichoic acid biosynthesis glycosyltransferase